MTAQFEILDSFVQERRNSIGGTDVAAICGLHPYVTAHDVYLSKIQETEKKDVISMRLGRVFEQGIGNLFAEETGAELMQFNTHKDELLAAVKDDVQVLQVTAESKTEYILRTGHLHGSVDFFAKMPNGDIVIVECKLSTSKTFKSQSEYFTHYKQYWVQLQWYMYITGIRKAYLSSVQFGFGGKHSIYEVDYDSNFISEILPKVNAFWDKYIVNGEVFERNIIQKMKDATKETNSDGIVIDTNKGHWSKKISELKVINSEIKMLQDQKTAIEQEIKDFLQEDDTLIDNDGVCLATYKSSSRSTFDTTVFKKRHPEVYEQFLRTTSYRSLLIK